ncbi:MAG TPA: pyridoxamine 5'-phosphate oxidase family protein [Acidimicrobiales bacterium]
MGTVDTRTWMEYLSEAECWDLLAETQVGRLGVLVDSAPEIYPVNHMVDGHSIVFRTDPGTKLAGLAKSPAVCFEVDGVDPERHKGWSVLVKGRAHELTDPDERHRVAERNLRYWSVGPKPHWIRIEAREVTGRRIHRSVDEVTDDTVDRDAADGDRAGADAADRVPNREGL